MQPLPAPPRLLPLLALAACLAASVRPARAQEAMRPEARAHYDEGLAHYAAGRFTAAIVALAAAYALDPRREILFAQAQATRLAGDCPKAVVLYEKFLATDPPPRQVEATRLALVRCRQALAAEPPKPVPPPPGPRPDPAAGLRTQAPRPPPRPWHRDVTGGVLAGGALVGLGVATGFFFAAHRADDRAQQAQDSGVGDYGQFDGPRLQAERRMAVSAVTLVGAVALGLGAAGRYTWVRWTPGPAPGGGLALGGGF